MTTTKTKTKTMTSELTADELTQYMLDQCAKEQRGLVCVELYKLILADEDRTDDPREAARQARYLTKNFPFDALRREQARRR
jgi:hypothetical protein